MTWAEMGTVRCALCREPAEAVGLCSQHLLEAYDHVGREVGVTDLLPSPCLACGSRLGVRYPSGWLCANCEWRVGELPDGDIAAVRVDVVYYVRFRDRIKIGTSGNPRSRLAQLRWDELLAFERGDRQVEHRRHAQFAAHRYPGSEWFATHDELERHVAELRAGVDDPWSQYSRWLSERVALGNS